MDVCEFKAEKNPRLDEVNEKLGAALPGKFIKIPFTTHEGLHRLYDTDHFQDKFAIKVYRDLFDSIPLTRK
jgi:hypothetical protein